MSARDEDHRLVAAELRKALGNCRIGNEIAVVEVTSSTNDLAWEAHKNGTPEGFVVFAEHQTAGRGQQGRHWESTPFQGLWFSVLLRPKMTLAESPKLTALLACALSAAIREQTGCFPQV